MDTSDFVKGLQEFKAFFTVKHIVVVAIIVFAILLFVCVSPQVTPIDTQSLDASDSFSVVMPLSTTKVGQENWQLDLPGGGWIDEESPLPSIKLVKHNEDKKCAIIMMKELTDEDISTYAMNNMQSVSNSFSKVDSINQIVLNNNQFIQIQLFGEGEMTWLWSTVKDSVGYDLACGCEIDPDNIISQRDLCSKVASSLQIK